MSSSKNRCRRIIRSLELDNVVLTPHLGWPTDSGFEGFAENAVTNILDYMAGKLTRALNPEALKHRRNAE